MVDEAASASSPTRTETGNGESTAVSIVAGILVRAEMALLCHRCAQRRLYPDVWDLPGGHVEDGESPRTALRRELSEELGIVAGGAAEPLALVSVPAQFDLTIYLVERWLGEPTNQAPDEHDEVRWVTREALDALRFARPEIRRVVIDAIARASANRMPGLGGPP